jgi:DNA helicase HerA-like ATPase
MAASPDLHLGWLLDRSDKVPVKLNASGLTSHTAVIAQSGSGKSFTLGRLLEEVISKTRARLLILDPNSDFVKFSEVNEGVWSDAKLKKWFGRDDTLKALKKRWDGVRFTVATTREKESLSLLHADAKVFPISLIWSRLGAWDKANYLGFSAAQDAEAVTTLQMAGEYKRQSG